MKREGGFALIAVLLVMAMVGVIGAEFAYSMRLEAASVRAYKDSLVGAHLAEAAVEQAIREIAGDGVYVATDDDGVLTFYTRDRRPLKRLPREKVPLGNGHFSYRLTDEEARLNVNTATPDRVSRLFEALGIDKIERDGIIASIQDWRDPNEDHRLNGAESEDTYLKLPVPYRSKNANFDSVNELLQVKGVTPAMLAGVDGKPGLADVVTVKTPGQVNINTAGPLVMRALNLSDAEYTEIVQSRRDIPYVNVGRFGNRGLAATTRTYRVEAEGILDGQVRARITAIVQKRADDGSENVTVLEWSGIR
jgi:type II secretory pathway component PulK